MGKTEEQKKSCLKRVNENLKTKMEIEIRQLEEWSGTTFKELIFDSCIHSWKQGDSEFDQIVFNREKLVFIIEDIEGHVFGGYVNAKIDKWLYCEDGNWKGSKITDEHAFVFLLKTYGGTLDPMKFNIKPEKKEWAFQLQKSTDDELFAFGGGNDIRIMKRNMKTQCYCSQSSFDYQGKVNILVGKEGKTNPFTVKRIQVFQMEETKE